MTAQRTCVYLDPHNRPACTECGRDLELCQCVNPDASAQERIHSPDGLVITMIRGELGAARSKFPDNLHQLVALGEEFGELCQAMMEHDRDGSQTVAMVLREAVQTACMAIRVATEGDDNFKYVFPVIEEDLPRGPVARQYD